MKYFHWIAFIIIIAVMFTACQRPNLDKPITVTVLFTNDTKSKIEGCGCHKAGGGILKRAYEINQTRKENPYTLYFDTGDFLFGMEQSNRTEGKLIIDALNYLQTDAVNVTPKEFTMGADKFIEAVKQAKFPLVTTNLKIAKTNQLAGEPYALKTIGDVVFGIMGVTGSETVSYLAGDKASEIKIEDPYESIRKYLPKMKKEADILVLLSFLGYDEDNNLAKQFPEFNIILGGRTAQRMDRADQIGTTFIMQAGNEGRYLGRAKALIDIDRTLSSLEFELVSMEANAPSDNDMLMLVQKWVPDFAYDNPSDRRSQERLDREQLQGVVDSLGTKPQETH